MQPYYQHNGVTIYHADCREVLPQLEPAEVIITDPVWPNCPAGLLIGADDPAGLLQSMLCCLPVLPKRLVLVMRHDSDPRLLSVVPPELPFFRTQILPEVMEL